VRIIVLGVVLGSVAAPPVTAQLPPVPVRNSLGAQVGDSGVGTATDYDALIGGWNIRFQSASRVGKDGSPTEYSPPRAGTWTFRRTHGGRMVEDEFRLGTSESGGTFTYRIFNPTRNLWEIQGTDVGSGRWDGGISWSDGGDRLVVQHTGSGVIRVRYYEITADHFLWRADASTDGGKTWLKDVMKIEADRRREP